MAEKKPFQMADPLGGRLVEERVYVTPGGHRIRLRKYNSKSKTWQVELGAGPPESDWGSYGHRRAMSPAELDALVAKLKIAKDSPS